MHAFHEFSNEILDCLCGRICMGSTDIDDFFRRNEFLNES